MGLSLVSAWLSASSRQLVSEASCGSEWSSSNSALPCETGVRVSRLASGRQQNRAGAHGEVPSPALTCNFIDVPQFDGPLTRERSRWQLVTMAPMPGRQSCPPCVWPAITRS